MSGRDETMSHAADALLCREAASHTQLSSAMLQSDIKQSVIDDAIARLTGVRSAPDTTVCIAQNHKCTRHLLLSELHIFTVQLICRNVLDFNMLKDLHFINFPLTFFCLVPTSFFS